jgi:hypothetical protein
LCPYLCPVNHIHLKTIATILSCLYALSTQAQRYSVEFHAGTSNYQGDLQEKRYTFQQSRSAFSIGVAYELTEHINLRGMFMITSLHADDKNNQDSALKARNLNFQTSLQELSFTGQYFLFNTSTARINPYAFIGLAIYHYDPYTYDAAGAKYYLQPLGTEGQGLAAYPDRKMYALTQFAIPFGGGVRFQVTDGLNIGVEVGLRKLFTDYLDDVSSSYVDQATLLAGRGPKSVELAYRTDELKNGNPVYPINGTKRGSPQFKDWYYTTGITANFKINGSGGKANHMGCPTKVY